MPMGLFWSRSARGGESSKQGDDPWARFERVLREHGPAVARTASSYARTRADREDLEQDIALALWRALPGFRGECSERTWVLRVAHNRGVSSLWKRASRRESPDEASDERADPRPSPESQAARSQGRERLLEALGALPLAQRQVLSLALEGLAPGEIAEVVGITPNNAMVRLSRARAKLEALLKGP